MKGITGEELQVFLRLKPNREFISLPFLHL